ncbi:D-apionate lactonase [Pararhizobium gei]|uniref:D-apionate lactonase n=1 Tax=Pararhizobium gei TaxID=1395951 RepID=UPI0023DB4930|nr:hypothetical protein [Rhizobium gei]
MSETAAQLALFGTVRQDDTPRLLKAGKLTAELAGGNLRNIRFDGVEVLRAISYLVRDRDWGTYAPAIADLEIHETEMGFIVSYSMTCDGPHDTVLHIAAAIEGDATGKLAFKVEAHTATGFETNRCGFCVLHPIVGVAGTPVAVEHVDGRLEHTILPDLIEPWQPFKEMRAITHTVLPGVTAACRMEGDTFEMEDQRNWSDASYKTYVRPLALPWPYRIAVGEPVVQHVELTIADSRTDKPVSPGDGTPESDGIIRISPDIATGAMPAIGLSITPEEAKTSLAALLQPDTLRIQHLLFHFDPGAGHGPQAFIDFAAIAAIHKGATTLEIAVPCRRPLNDEMQEIAALMRNAGFRPDAIMVCPSVDRQSTPPGSAWPDCPPLDDVYAAAAQAFSGIRLGGGMLSYFTELNRKRVPPAQLGFISHCTNPIVHAADDISVMQTLEALPFITRSVRAIYGSLPYRIGPSTIAMRQNPYGSRTMDNPDGGRICMAKRDPRHNGRFAEAFALGYAANVLDAGLECLTLSALTGPFGLFADIDEPVAAGRPRPLHNTVALLARLSGAQWRAYRSSSPAEVLAFSTNSDGQRSLHLVNITGASQHVEITEEGAGASSQTTLGPFETRTLPLV